MTPLGKAALAVASAILGAVLGTALSAPPALAQDAKPVRVLSLHVEGYDLTAKDKEDLFQVVQAKLKKYPNITLVKPPDRELTDEMIDLECVDIDTDCLVKLGRKYDATRVFYVQVDPEGGPEGESFKLVVRVVNVNRKRSLRDLVTKVAARADLAGALEKEVVEVFGEEPTPEEKEGTILIATTVPGAKIFVDGKYAGTGKITLKKEAGKYGIRVAKDGFQEKLFEVEVKAGELTQEMVKLDPMEETKFVDPDRKDPGGGGEDDKPLYKSGLFWGIVGGVAVVATVVAVAAAGGEEDAGSRGSVLLSIDRNAAWRDAAIRRQSP